MTIGEARQFGSKELAGFTTGVLDSEVLLGAVISKDRSFIIAHPEVELSIYQIDEYRAFIARRRSHEPVAYIVGEKEFYDMSFIVDNRVLIPRPETELLVSIACDAIRSRGATTLWDIGTGSGCIAIAIAQHCPEVTVVATDSSRDALKVAKLNLNRYRLNSRISLVHGMVPPDTTGPDIITANLPYIRSADMRTLSRDVAQFEPSSALDGGEDGLQCYRELFSYVATLDHMPHTIIIEIDPRQRLAVQSELQKIAPNAAGTFHADLASLDRVVVITQ